MTKNSFLMVLNQRNVLLIFLAGKILRFLFFMSFLFYLVKGADGLAGYNSTQSIFFFLSFMVIDTTAQFFYREVYRFRSYLVSGDFDLILVKPVSALFRTLMGGADVIDLFTLPPLYFATFYVGSLLSPAPYQVFLYLVLLIIGFLITTAFHIIVIALGIISLEVDHTMMIYRDITSMGRFPTDIYKQPVRGILTYLIPVAIMMTFPAKAFMKQVSFQGVLLAIVMALVSMIFAFRFWGYALKKYSSASS